MTVGVVVLAVGAELSGAPTAISQRWLGCPCAGFIPAVVTDACLVIAACLATGGLTVILELFGLTWIGVIV